MAFVCGALSLDLGQSDGGGGPLRSGARPSAGGSLSSPLPPDLETPRQAAVLPPTPPQRLTELEPGPGAEPEPKQLKLYIPAIPNYNVIGLLIGPRGQTQRLLEKVPLLT